MSSYEDWEERALDKKSTGSLNEAIRNNYNNAERQTKKAVEDVIGNPKINPNERNRRTADRYNNPTIARAVSKLPQMQQDLQAIHAFVQNLGTTYYGKQWISKLKEKVCYYQGENFQEKIFTSTPTNAGGWIDTSSTLLGLSEPELTFFRSEDNRINCFAVFNSEGEGNIGDGEETGTAGETEVPDGMTE
jgi:hypothetical protein